MSRSKIDFVLISLLGVWGLLISLFYGRMSYMPLDQSIIFDGAWRLLSGQIPYRDFYTPNGLTPIFIQTIFFKLLGVNWFAYCLHAAIINGIFCGLVYIIFRYLNSPIWIGFLYSALSGVVMYPPMGVPYMEQHAFFFSLLSVGIAIIALSSTKPLQIKLCWFLVPITLGLAFFSKQIPTVFFIPVIVALIFISKAPKIALIYGIIGAFSMMGFLGLIGLIFKIPFETFYFYFYQLPASIGQQRTGDFSETILSILSGLPGWTLRLYTIIISQILFYYLVVLMSRTFPYSSALSKLIVQILIALTPLLLVPLAIAINPYQASYVIYFGGAVAAFLGFYPSKKLDFLSNYFRHFWKEIILSETLLLICFLFIKFTSNQLFNGTPYIFISFGILTLCIYKALNIKRLYPVPLNRIRKIIALGITLIMVFVAITDAQRFNRFFNQTRLVNDLYYNPQQAQLNSQNLPAALNFMLWYTPDFYKFTSTDFTNVVKFLNSHSDNFFLVGDSSILYGITNRPSVNPSLWFHPGLTIPQKNTEEFEEYQDKLIQNLEKYNVKYIIFEEPKTFMGSSIEDFPRLQVYLQEQACRQALIGTFRLVELCP